MYKIDGKNIQNAEPENFGVQGKRKRRWNFDTRKFESFATKAFDNSGREQIEPDDGDQEIRYFGRSRIKTADKGRLLSASD